MDTQMMAGERPVTPGWVNNSEYAPIPFLKSNFAPIDREVDLPNLTVKGEIPAGLAGTFYRIGPNQRFAPAADYHWFEADGMIHALEIRDGKVSYRNRWMRTRKWEAEDKAGRSLFGGFGDPKRADPSVADLPFNVNNTAMVQHHGHIYALEEGSPPFRFDPKTLASIGTFTFDGQLAGPMTAHPKIDPLTGELVVYGYAAGGRGSPDVSWAIISPTADVTRAGLVHGPYCGFMHDFVLTQNFMIFPFFPATQSVARQNAGLPYTAWEAGLGTHYAVVRRDGTGEVRWFRQEDRFAYHVMNGHDDGTTITFDLVLGNHIGNFPNADGSAPEPEAKVSRLSRITLDMAGNSDVVRQETLDDIYVDFPLTDPRNVSLPYRVGFAGGVLDPNGGAIGWNAVVRYDMQSGAREAYSFGPGTASWEPFFVPRSEEAAEGDGWLLSMVFRAAGQVSELAIFESTDVEAGPVATVEIPHRVPFGFHGLFVAD